MDIVKNAKDIGYDIERGVELVGEKVSEAFGNLASHLPFANLAKKDNSSFEVEVDLPGVKKEDIDVRIEGNTLVVSAVRNYKNEVKREDYYVCESSFGKIERRFTLPSSVDTENIHATFRDGRLEVELHKTQNAQPKSITIN